MPSPLVTCDGCTHRFAVSNTFTSSFATCPNCDGMIVLDKSDVPDTSGTSVALALKSNVEKRNQSALRMHMIFAGVLVSMVSLLQIAMNGPQFLFFYFVCGLTAVGGVFAATSQKSWVGVIVWVCAFELIGVVRLVYGMSQGMHRFEILLMTLLAAPFVLMIVAAIPSMDLAAPRSRQRGSRRSGSSFWSSSCSAGSSCSSCSSCSSSSCSSSSCGSSCGGGGCGGCGD